MQKKNKKQKTNKGENLRGPFDNISTDELQKKYFGGKERIQALQNHFARIKNKYNVSLIITTGAYYTIVDQALTMVGLREYFEKINCKDSTTKSGAIDAMIKEQGNCANKV